jgi:hypothetical protein
MENPNKLMRAGGTFENQGFLYTTVGGRADFKGSSSEAKMLRDYVRDKGEERERLGGQVSYPTKGGVR